MLARRVADQVTHGLAAAGIPTTGSSGGSSDLNLAALPPAIQNIVRAAYGDTTEHIFLISAAIAVARVIAAPFLKPVTLRTSLDRPDTATSVAVAADAVDGAPPFDQVDLEDAETIDAPVRTTR